MNNNNPVTEERKNSLTKVLAIVGFLALIVLMVWMAVKIVGFIPNAFSSLASIADSVYNHNRTETLSVSTEKSVINAGESFTVTWDTLRTPGTYQFSYACVDGVSIEVRDERGTIRPLACDAPLVVTNMNALDIRGASEQNRFTDVRYVLAFIPNDTARDITTREGSVTIVNASIPTAGTDTPAPEDGESDELTTETPGTEDGDEVAESPAPTTPTQPIYREVLTYSVPVSDPNGRVDLQVTHRGVGVMSGNRFTPAGQIRTNQQGAIQFEIKNIGTKTADSWSYVADLPSDIEYRSGTQKALKPNESALITLAFEGISETGTERFGVTVTASGDVNTRNNAFTWAVNVVR